MSAHFTTSEIHAIIIANLLIAILLLWAGYSVVFGAPWIPARRREIRRALRMAELRPGEALVDLGSGDGRVLLIAAREYGALARGVEIDPLRCWISRAVVRMLGFGESVAITRGNVYTFDELHDTDVVVLHLSRVVNLDLSRLLATRLKVGARVVSLKFSLEGPAMGLLHEADGIYVYEITPSGPLSEPRSRSNR